MDQQGSITESSITPARQAGKPGRVPQEAGHPGVRWLFIALGWFCVGLAIIGAVLPVMPTTVFLLAALWAFSRGSQRFHDWLYTHPRFGPPLQAWEQHGVIRPAAKLLAVLMMAASFGVTVVLSSGPLVPAILAVVLSAVALFILTRPSRSPAEG
ncbi:MAG TPA: YbaN family protein [Alphaproteobacteria bacterium]|nr:YbaN family protein [Alphaproteobacteria bacterium]